MSSTSDEVGHTAFDLETIGYYVGNPSAWEEGFDQRISDQIGKAVEEIQRLRNSHDSLVKALERIASPKLREPKRSDYSSDDSYWEACGAWRMALIARAALSQAKGGK